MLLDTGAQFEQAPMSLTCYELERAAQYGNLEIVELLVPWMLAKDRSLLMMRTQGSVHYHVAKHQQSHLVRPTLLDFVEWEEAGPDQFKFEVYVRRAFCVAAHYGEDDLVHDILAQRDPGSWSSELMHGPLQSAARSGNLSTCKLLLDYSLTSIVRHSAHRRDDIM